MATYSSIAAGEKDADSPITVSLIDKLDQNPHAIAEGAAGAPKVQNAAFNDRTLSQFKINKPAPVSGTTYTHVFDCYLEDFSSLSVSSYRTRCVLQVLVSGTYTFDFAIISNGRFYVTKLSTRSTSSEVIANYNNTSAVFDLDLSEGNFIDLYIDSIALDYHSQGHFKVTSGNSDIDRTYLNASIVREYY